MISEKWLNERFKERKIRFDQERAMEHLILDLEQFKNQLLFYGYIYDPELIETYQMHGNGD